MKRAISEEAKDKRREDIIIAALEEFYQNGFKATKMEDIALRSNVSKGTLYLYFKSKEEVFQAVIETVAKPRISIIQTKLGTTESLTVALNNFFEFLPTLVCQTPMPKLMKVLISDVFVFPEVVQSYRQQVIDQALGAITSALTIAKERNQITIDSPELTAQLIIAPLIFSVIWKVVFEKTGESPLDVHALFAQHRNNIFIALGLEP